MKKLSKSDLKFLSGFNFYTPGFGGTVILLLWLLVGSLLGNAVIAGVTPFLGPNGIAKYGTLIAYPLMFIPPMIYAGYKSRRNILFETGYKLDSSHFGKTGGAVIAILAVIATIGTAFMTDLINSKMPEMPEWLENVLDGLTHGNVWINLFCVSILAPICEEWLCRGQVLRGLLNFRRADESAKSVHPAIAILISALFFAIIHANPWQAIPAFVLGCLFGYVYYRTGSLKLTMLMHCANNTVAVICGQIDALADMDYWTEVFSTKMYFILFAACALFVAMFILTLSHIEMQGKEGNCDPVTE